MDIFVRLVILITNVNHLDQDDDEEDQVYGPALPNNRKAPVKLPVLEVGTHVKLPYFPPNILYSTPFYFPFVVIRRASRRRRSMQ